jgi:hypothetical protein
MDRRYQYLILLIASALCIILLYGTSVYPSVRSSRTIRNIEISGNIASYLYPRDNKFEILEASLSITNNGPLEVILRDVNMTITLENDGSLIIPVNKEVSISPSSTHQFTLAPPTLTATYEPHTILETLQDHHLEYQLNMSAFASCGTFQGPISKTSDGVEVFLHIPPSKVSASFQHGVALGQDENETIVIYTTAPQWPPQSFRVGRINDQWTDRKHFWGTELYRLEKIRFSINASEPVNVQIILAAGPDLSNYTAKEALIEISSTSYISENFTAPTDGLYVFRFQISQPLSTSTVIFDCVRFWP